MITKSQNIDDKSLATDNTISKAIEVRFTDVLLFVKKYFKIVLFVAIISGILGVAFSFTLTKTYEAKTVLLPEYGSAKRGSLSLLAAGLSSDGAEKLLPDLYPTILQSSPFGAFLLNQPVTDKNNRSYKSMKSFLESQQQSNSPGFFSRIFGGSSDKEAKPLPKLSYNGVLSYSVEEQAAIGKVLSLFSASVDPKSGVIEISAESTDPFISAIAAENAKKYLIQYVEDYRTSRASQNVTMLTARANEAKKRLRNAELALQGYRDRNRNTFMNVARLEEQRLQSEYILVQSVYDDLTRRLEQAKITVKDEKPVFKVLEPVKVPLSKSGPKRLKIGMLGAFLGSLLCIIYILVRTERVFSYMTLPEVIRE